VGAGVGRLGKAASGAECGGTARAASMVAALGFEVRLLNVGVVAFLLDGLGVIPSALGAHEPLHRSSTATVRAAGVCAKRDSSNAMR